MSNSSPGRALTCLAKVTQQGSNLGVVRELRCRADLGLPVPGEELINGRRPGQSFALPPATMGFALRAGIKGNIETGPGSEFRSNREMRGSGTKQNTRPECSIAEKEHVL